MFLASRLRERMAQTSQATRSSFDVQRVRAQFPALQQEIDGKPWVYLDSAATSQKPQVVIDRLARLYATEYAKTQEKHALSQHVTELVEGSRRAARLFVGGRDEHEAIFSRSATGALNMLANSFAEGELERGDEILLTDLEHHSNVVPWLMAAKRTGARVRSAPLDENGDVDLDYLADMVNRRTRVIAVTHVSNVLGTVVPIEKLARIARDEDVPLVVDGAQAPPHMQVDVEDLGCDFYVYSSHKLYGPSGVGVTVARKAWLERLPPSQGGAEMAKEVTFDGFEPSPVPQKFEAGTPAVAEVAALSTALDWVKEVGVENVRAHVSALLEHARGRLAAIKGVRVLGDPRERVGLVSFTVGGASAMELEKWLDEERAIAIRGGDLACQPLMKELGVKEAARISLAAHTTREEVDLCIDEVERFVSAPTRVERG